MFKVIIGSFLNLFLWWFLSRQFWLLLLNIHLRVLVEPEQTSSVITNIVQVCRANLATVHGVSHSRVNKLLRRKEDLLCVFAMAFLTAGGHYLFSAVTRTCWFGRVSMAQLVHLCRILIEPICSVVLVYRHLEVLIGVRRRLWIHWPLLGVDRVLQRAKLSLVLCSSHWIPWTIECENGRHDFLHMRSCCHRHMLVVFDGR